MDGRTIIESVSALKAVLELIKATLPFLRRPRPGVKGCPGPDFIPIRRTYYGPCTKPSVEPATSTSGNDARRGR